MKYLIRYFLLRVLSAEFQTSRSEARQQRKSCKLSLLGSCPHSLPSSVKIFIILEAHGNSEIPDPSKPKKGAPLSSLQLSLRCNSLSPTTLSPLQLSLPYNSLSAATLSPL